MPTRQQSQEDAARILAPVIVEWLFVALPLLLVLLYKREALFTAYDWSFGSIILIGLSVAKLLRVLLAQSPASTGRKSDMAVLLVVGLMIVEMFLAKLGGDMVTATNPSLALKTAQVAAFVGASLVFVLLASYSERAYLRGRHHPGEGSGPANPLGGR